MNRIAFVLFLLFFAELSTAQNVQITNQGNPNEPSINFDPFHPDRIMAACNINNYFLSVDSGATWTSHSLNSTYGVWGDPNINVDAHGDFYFFHLSNPQEGNWIDRIVCQKTTDFGQNWTNGSYAGLNGTKAQDKHWTCVDRSDNTIYMTWTQFDDYDSQNPADSSIILFSKSVDAGDSWTPAIRISQTAGDCLDDDNTTEGAVPAVGPNGEVYVAWAGPLGLTFDRSMDGGETWLENDIHIDDMPMGWNYTIPGISRANGLPITKCDTTGGEFNGTIYVNWSDQRNGEDDTDVWLSKSTDQGNTWSTPVRVNDDAPGKQQFFTWMDVDQANGDLYFVFYDRRNYNDNHTDVYIAKSTDGGETFTNIKISESPFIPNEGVFFGDYNNIIAYNGFVRPIWTRLNEGQLSLWTHIATYEDIDDAVQEQNPVSSLDVKEFPNPAGDHFFVSYKLHQPAKVSIILYDSLGKEIKVYRDNVSKNYGKYVETLSLEGVPSGAYIYKILVNKLVVKSDGIVVK